MHTLLVNTNPIMRAWASNEISKNTGFPKSGVVNVLRASIWVWLQLPTVRSHTCSPRTGDLATKPRRGGQAPAKKGRKREQGNIVSTLLLRSTIGTHHKLIMSIIQLEMRRIPRDGHEKCIPLTIAKICLKNTRAGN